MPNTINIARLIIDAQFQARAHVDSDLVKEYAEAMKAGAIFPPIHVYDIPDRGLVVVDGHQRVAAATACGLKAITANVTKGSELEALVAAFGANRTHGARRTRADLRAIIERALKHDELVKRADAWLAEDIGCSDMTVRSQREQLESVSQIRNLDSLIGRDGKVYPREKKQAAFEIASHYTIAEWQALDTKQRKTVLNAPAKGALTAQDDAKDDEEGNIEWARWSWNPITGCEHDCPYCYARDISTRFSGSDAYPNGFKPTLVPHRLALPLKSSPPAKVESDPAFAHIFVGSMTDLFGRWVPDAWIEAVLDTIQKAKQWQFLCLTKFPARMADFKLPDNLWAGTSVDCQARVRNAERAMERIDARVKWYSVEPMIEPLQFERLDLVQWIVIGGASKSTQTPAWRPPRKWVDKLEREARSAGCAVYEKTNLLQRFREYPGASPLQLDRAPDVFHYLGKPSEDQRPEQRVIALVPATKTGTEDGK